MFRPIKSLYPSSTSPSLNRTEEMNHTASKDILFERIVDLFCVPASDSGQIRAQAMRARTCPSRLIFARFSQLVVDIQDFLDQLFSFAASTSSNFNLDRRRSRRRKLLQC